MIHLNTNVAIALLNGRPHQVRTHFDAARAAQIPFGLSSVVYHELMYGAAASARRCANEEKITLFIASGRIALIDFNAADAGEAADIRAYLRRQGTPIGPYDVLIAAQARRAGAALVTADTSEFGRVPGLQVLDWTGPLDSGAISRSSPTEAPHIVLPSYPWGSTRSPSSMGSRTERMA